MKLASDPVRLLRGERGYQKAQALASIGFDEFARAELEVLGREAAADGDRAWALGIAFAELGELFLGLVPETVHLVGEM